MENSEKKEKEHSRIIERWQVVAGMMILLDTIVLIGSWFLALWLRFDGRFGAIPEQFINPYRSFILIYTGCCIIVFQFAGMYRTIWSFASLNMLIRSLVVSACASVLHIILITVLYGRMPLSYYIIGTILQGIGLAATRFGNRLRIYFRQMMLKRSTPGRRIMLIGAGDAGASIFRDIKARKNGDQVVCVIDDNPNKRHRDFGGAPIVGGREDILGAVEKFISCMSQLMRKRLIFA